MDVIKPPQHQLVDCPPSRGDGGGGGRQQRQAWTWRNATACQKTWAILLPIAALITGLTLMCVFLDRNYPSKPPVYTVAITGVTGLDQLLDPARDADPPASPPVDYHSDYSSTSPPLPPPPLSPVLDLTFQIDNTRNAQEDACVPGLSRVDVSYGDAFLGGASVPAFCTGKMRRTDPPLVVRAWAQNVVLPQFLYDQLAAELAAGDASVDVKVTMGSDVLSCKAKIGGGGASAPACRLDSP